MKELRHCLSGRTDRAADPCARPRNPSNTGFTLIELMIVVAVVALLASIAVPAFYRYQLKTRRTEAYLNIKSIAVAETAYEKSYDAYIECQSSPTTALDGEAYPFDSSITGWEDLGWVPDGEVRCHYYVTMFTNPRGSWVRPSAICDFDRDKKYATWFMDVDPRGTSSSSQNMVLRGDNPTTAQNRY